MSRSLRHRAKQKPSPAILPPELIDLCTKTLLLARSFPENPADRSGGVKNFLLTETLAKDLKEWGLITRTAERYVTFADLGDGLNDFPGPFHEFWAKMSPPVRDDLRDFAVWRGLKNVGPSVLTWPVIQQHIDALWTTMQTAPEIAARKAAIKRWRRIFTGAVPNLRKMKDRVSPLVVKEAYDLARARLKQVTSLQPRPSLRALERAAIKAFPGWSKHLCTEIARNILARDHAQVRALTLKAVGRLFGREASTVRDLITRANTFQRLRQRYDLAPVTASKPRA